MGTNKTRPRVFRPETGRSAPDPQEHIKPADLGYQGRWPDWQVRDDWEDAPPWGGGVHTWCRCGCTGDEVQAQPVPGESSFPFIDPE